MSVTVGEYYHLTAGPSDPPRRRLPSPAALLCLVVGLLLGYGLATGSHSAGAAAPEFKWLRSPSMRWLRQRTDAAAPMVGGSQVRLYDAGETAKFLTLRERIDEQLDTQLNLGGGDGDADDDGAAATYDPLRLLALVAGRVDAEFDRFLREILDAGAGGEGPAGGWSLPTFEYEESDTEIAIRCSGPGLRPEQMTIDLRGQQLTVQVTGTQTDEHATVQTAYARMFIVPEGVTPEDVTASAEGQVLSIIVKKPLPRLAAAEPVAIRVAEE